MVGNQGLQSAAAIEAYAVTGADQTTTAIDRYAALLGELLRELSLAKMPSSGIYLAGCDARALTAKSPRRCVDVFRSPGGINQNDTTAIWTIDDDASALLGCARFAFS